jgi:phosphate-selective porin
MTGEKKHGRVNPKRALFQGGAGAFELAARLEQLRFEGIDGTGLRRNGDRATTLGLNWYLNRFMKVQPNLIIESIRDPQRSPAPSHQGRFISGIVRFQFTL